MTLGCSNGVGWGVPHDSVFTELLESTFNSSRGNLHYSVINAGVGNYNTVMEHLQLQEKFKGVSPDMVLVHYYINDAEIVEYYSPGYLVKHAYLAALLYNRSRYAAFQKQYPDVGGYYTALYAEDAKGWENAKRAMLAIQQICSSASIPLLVVLQPDLHDLSKESLQAECHHILSGFLESSNIEYLDLLPAFASKFGENPQEAWVSPQDPHPNIAGHRLIYQELNNYLHTHHFNGVN
jgi:hypothetical protein